MATYSVTIEGVERECLLEGLEIREALNRIPVMSAHFVSLDATFRPALDDEIIITENGTRIFGGLIEFAEEAGFGGPAGDAIVTRINGVGYASYADRRFINGVLEEGTLKHQLQQVETYLTTFGVSLDGAQVDGPQLAASTVVWRKAKDVLNDLSGLTTGTGSSPTEPAYVWEIDAFKTLRMFQMGDEAAPADLIEGDGLEVGDLVVTPNRQNYANRVILVSNDTADSVVAEDTAAQAAYGLWEKVFETKAYLSPDIQQMASQGLLAQFSAPQVEARFSTVTLGFHPGQTMTITSAKRNVDGAFVIIEVTTRNEPNGEGLIREVLAMQGYRLQGSWQDVLEAMTPDTPGPGPGGGGTGSAVSCCDAIGAGTLAFSGFGEDPMKFLSPSGRILPPPPHNPDIDGACDGLVALDNGVLGLAGVGSPGFPTSSVGVMSADLTTKTDSSPAVACRSIARDDHGYFYSITLTDARILQFDDTATKTGDWATGGTFGLVIGVNGDGTVAFYVLSGSLDTVRAWDLSGDTDLGVFVINSGYAVQHNGLLGLHDGGLLVGWDKSGSAGPGYIAHYDAAGSLLYTYTLTGTSPAPIVLTPGLTPATFWCSYYDNLAGDFTNSGVRVVEIQLEFGCVMNMFMPDAGSFQFDGPFCVLRGKVT